MPTYVRVSDVETLRERIEQTGRYVDVAYRAGIHPVRLSQILGERSPVLRLEQAAKLEDLLGVEHGTLFVVDDPVATELIGPYLAHDRDEPTGTTVA